MERGDSFSLTRMDISAHTGTHVDAPAHFVAGGSGVDSLDLDVLIGPALVVDARSASVLSAAVLESLAIPAGTQRVLFRTRNSELWRRPHTVFDEDFVAIPGRRRGVAGRARGAAGGGGLPVGSALRRVRADASDPACCGCDCGGRAEPERRSSRVSISSSACRSRSPAPTARRARAVLIG